MEQQSVPVKSLSFSEVLDVTFHIVKENFSKLLLILLIFIGPMYLLQGVIHILGGVALLSDPNRTLGLTSILGSFTPSGTQGASTGLGTTPLQSILLFISTLLLVFISTPISYASLIIATEQIRKKEKVNFKTIIKQALSRYWALLGGTLVYGLIISALYIGMIFIIVFYLAMSVGFEVFKGLAAGSPVGSTAGLGIHILVVVVLALITFLGFIYLTTRWSFFFAAIVFEKVSPGLSKSWKLTRGYFWRLVGLYLVYTILMMIIYIALYLGVGLTLGNSVLAFLLRSLVTLLITMTAIIAYAVIYSDLRVRNEAVDLKVMLKTYQDNKILSNTEVAIGQSTTARTEED